MVRSRPTASSALLALLFPPMDKLEDNCGLPRKNQSPTRSLLAVNLAVLLFIPLLDFAVAATFLGLAKLAVSWPSR